MGQSQAKSPRIAVILCGAGRGDGSEIHEATLTLLALAEAGAEAVCFAPDRPQSVVVDHYRDEPATGEARNMLVESARIARGAVRPLAEASVDELDGAIIPGGFGAALNLCDFAGKGAAMSVDADLSRLLTGLGKRHAPIGAICIAPVILAKVFAGRGPRLTIGNDKGTAAAMTAMGATHVECSVEGIVSDDSLNLVTTPAYMLGSWIGDVAPGIRRLVGEVVARSSAHPSRRLP